jgi:hypothetical protein
MSTANVTPLNTGDPLTDTINRTIRALIVLRGMDAEGFRQAAGLARNTYFNRMRGRGDWTAHEVKRAADALGVSVATLYDGLSVAGAGFEPATSGSRARHLRLVSADVTRADVELAA